MEEGEEVGDRPLQPPTAERVAARCLVLAAVACRGEIDSDPGADDFRRRMIEWLIGCNLTSELEPAERELLWTPVGGLESQVRVNATWRSEAVGILGWALGHAELPVHDAQVAPRVIGDAIGFMTDVPIALRRPSLRPEAELEWCSELMFSVHWRLVEFSLHRRAMNFREVADTASFGPLVVDGLAFAEDDLAADGAPLVQSPRWRELLSIAMERHKAANWLVGYEAVYSEVPTDT